MSKVSQALECNRLIREAEGRLSSKATRTVYTAHYTIRRERARLNALLAGMTEAELIRFAQRRNG